MKNTFQGWFSKSFMCFYKFLKNDLFKLEETISNLYPESLADMLSRRDLGIQRRREMIHKKWEEKVFVPIHNKIHSQLNKDYLKFKKEKMKLYENYLNVSFNTKPLHHNQLSSRLF